MISDQTATAPISVSGLPILTLIDSVVPEIWLPLQACAVFESEFGLTWNETYHMYLVNDTLHAALLTKDLSVTFSLAANTSASSGIEITLPYLAFDLTAKYPLAGIQDNTTSPRYFPLKRAANATQYYLGRTFLQEAYVLCANSICIPVMYADCSRYVTADYDNASFTVAPVIHPNPNIITPVGATGRAHGLKAGVIAGIALGAVAAVAFLAGLLFWLWRRRRTQRAREQVTDSKPDEIFVKAELDADETAKKRQELQDAERRELEAGIGQEVEAVERQELDAGEAGHELGADDSARMSHRTGLMLGRAASGVRHERGRSGLFELE